MERNAFLQRVRDAATSGRAYRVPLAGDVQPDDGYEGAGDDPPARMASEIAAVGGHAHLCENLAQARERVDMLLRQHGAAHAFCWRHELLDRLGLDELLGEHGTQRVDHATLHALPRDEQRRRMLAAGLGISSVTWAVAETGSLVMASAAGRERLASLLPPVHIAVVERGQILPDLFDLFEQLDPLELASNLVLITGPSKTGDLELKLTTGVHGPGVLHVVIVR